MRAKGPMTMTVAAALFAALINLSAASEDAPATATGESTDHASTGTAEAPSVTVLNNHEVEGILGRQVLGAADENMGRIVDVIVDRDGMVRAAVIDFGGFLGVGSRKIVVDWRALRFGAIANKSDSISLELTKDQVSKAPEYKEDQPVIVLGAAGSLQPWEFDH
jgi:PRC-barrel domain